jgi:chemotaxis protein CheD
MATINVGIGEWAVSGNPDDIIKTYALGSCVAVIIHDVKVPLVGLIHIALPDSTIDPARAKELPGYFADTGLAVIIEEMKKRGASRPNVRVMLAGGATVMDDKGIFDIGKRNLLAIKRILWTSSLGAIAEDTGLDISRTVTVRVSDGDTTISSGSKTWNIQERANATL